MSLSSILISNGPTPSESLTRSLRAVLAWAGLQVDYDEVNTALGLSFLICAREEEPSPTAWKYLARDVCLAEAAGLFGVRARALHPRPAAEGLAATPEYQGHFVDSYVPLIKQSLRENQPALTWQGWPGEMAPLWGVLTGETDAGLGLSGVVTGSDEPVPLTSAAIQCYVVEEITPTPQRPQAASVLRCGIDAVHRLGGHPAGEPPDLISGPDAYDCWTRRLEAETAPPAAAEHIAFATAVASNRQAAGRFLEARQESLPGKLKPQIETLRASCQATVDALAQVIDAFESGGKDVRRTAAPHLRAAQSAERQTTACLEVLADMLNARSSPA